MQLQFQFQIRVKLSIAKMWYAYTRKALLDISCCGASEDSGLSLLGWISPGMMDAELLWSGVTS